MKPSGAPLHLVSASGSEWELVKIDGPKETPLEYKLKDASASIGVSAVDVETDWTRKGRPDPKSAIIVQGKYECAAASLAMLLGESLFSVKRAMGKAGWRNDDRGAGDQIMIEAARYLGRDILKIGRYQFDEITGPASVTLPSLNIKGMYHAVTWTGEEILDPNWGREGRKFWGCEWNPQTIGARSALILLPNNMTEDQRKRQDKFGRSHKSLADIRCFSEQIMKELEVA